MDRRTQPLMSNTFVLPTLPELRSTQVFGRTIRYYDVGSGPPLVLIHGIGGDADDWAFCLAPLSASHRVIALDLLGFGRSDKPAIEYYVAGFVEVLQRLLQILEIGRAALMGESLGGWIAAAFALHFPKAVGRLILIDAAGVGSGAGDLPVDLRISTRTHMREVLEHLFYDKSLVTGSLVDLVYEQHLERGDGPTIRSLLRNLRDGRERLDNVIGNLQIPTLILWGEQDEIIPLAIGRRFQQLIANSKFEVISECGHLPQLEKPNQVVRFALEFLAE